MSPADDPMAWMAKAHNDLLCVDNNLAAQRVPWDAVVYHAQQAVEKTLKAFLISRHAPMAHTHDLGRLLDDCVAAGGALSQFLDDCDRLTAYAVQFRYPGEGSDIEESEARAMVVASKKIVDAVAAMLSQ